MQDPRALVRPAIEVLSIATDGYGRVLSCRDFFSDGARLSIVKVPARGVSTIYARWGDVFSIGCIVAFSALVGVAFILARREKLS